MTEKRSRTEKIKRLASLGISKDEITISLQKSKTDEQVYTQGRIESISQGMSYLKNSNTVLGIVFFILLLRLAPITEYVYKYLKK